MYISKLLGNLPVPPSKLLDLKKMDISQRKYMRIGMCVLISLGFNYLNLIS